MAGLLALTTRRLKYFGGFSAGGGVNDRCRRTKRDSWGFLTPDRFASSFGDSPRARIASHSTPIKGDDSPAAGFFRANDPEGGHHPVNAGAETVATTPMCRDAFARHRRLILACGLYEWTGPKGAKKPFAYPMVDGEGFAFAAVWNCWKGGGEPLYTCAMLTISSNALVQPVHDLIPVILPRDAYDACSTRRWTRPVCSGCSSRTRPTGSTVRPPTRP